MRSSVYIKKNLKKYFKIQNVDQLEYKFKDGNKVVITDQTQVDFLTTKQLQALAQHIHKTCEDQSKSKVLKSVPSEKANNAQKGSTEIPEVADLPPDKKYHKKLDEFFNKITKTKTYTEDRLHIPKVFSALLTQPHTAFDQTIKKTEEITETGLLIIDIGSGYWNYVDYLYNREKCGIVHSNLMTYPGLKNWDIIYTVGEQFRTYNNFKVNTKNKNVLNNANDGANLFDSKYEKLIYKHYDKIVYISQGCGHTNIKLKQLFKSKSKFTFLTPYTKGCNCGCSRISHLERTKFKIIYRCADLDHLLSTV